MIHTQGPSLGWEGVRGWLHTERKGCVVRINIAYIELKLKS